jgi:hypothetical protein
LSAKERRIIEKYRIRRKERGLREKRRCWADYFGERRSGGAS